jgi:hypothetical protein
MTGVIVETVLLMAAAYLIVGLVFSIFFVTILVAKIDESAQKSSWGFRLIIIPGVVVFWPVLLKKIFRSK